LGRRTPAHQLKTVQTLIVPLFAELGPIAIGLGKACAAPAPLLVEVEHRLRRAGSDQKDAGAVLAPDEFKVYGLARDALVDEASIDNRAFSGILVVDAIEIAGLAIVFKIRFISVVMPASKQSWRTGQDGLTEIAVGLNFDSASSLSDRSEDTEPS
jgi:hypothetical protein